MSRVIQSPEARNDLKSIARHIAQQSGSTEVARRFLNAIGRKCDTYAVQPGMGEACPHLAENVRRFSHGNFNIYFRASKAGIEIVRVIHGSRDEFGAWFSRPPK